MLLTLTYATPPATDLGYLLHKSPVRSHAFEMAFGNAHVFYPEAGLERCTAALLLEVDPVLLARRQSGGTGRADQEPWVNDRPYVASSLLSVAIGEAFRSAISGRSKERPELAARALALEARIAVLPCRGGEAYLRRLFEPLGYAVEATQHVLDERFPEWGASRHFSVVLRGEKRLCDLLAHLYVLIPVLDDRKHYWVGDDEVAKLLRRGEGWLATHPERESIARRYLKHQRSLARLALDHLMAEDAPEPDETAATRCGEEAAIERGISLNEQRLGAVLGALRQCGARRVLDLGCGEGRLLRILLDDRSFEEVVGVDVSQRSLEIAAERLRVEQLPPMQRSRLKLIQGSLTYRDARLRGYDAAAAVEVIEHLDPHRLSSFERALFEHARPATVVITTPNAEYNSKFESLPAGTFRHRDHRFEWTRVEMQAWALGVAGRFGYAARFLPVGPEDAVVGAPTQMAVFQR